jgi:hypothetical protein
MDADNAEFWLLLIIFIVIILVGMIGACTGG